MRVEVKWRAQVSLSQTSRNQLLLPFIRDGRYFAISAANDDHFQRLMKVLGLRGLGYSEERIAALARAEVVMLAAATPAIDRAGR